MKLKQAHEIIEVLDVILETEEHCIRRLDLQRARERVLFLKEDMLKNQESWKDAEDKIKVRKQR
ncbi:hypothetical protein ACFLXA_02850 [Chloroflexota bacterium]